MWSLDDASSRRSVRERDLRPRGCPPNRRAGGEAVASPDGRIDGAGKATKTAFAKATFGAPLSGTVDHLSSSATIDYKPLVRGQVSDRLPAARKASCLDVFSWAWLYSVCTGENKLPTKKGCVHNVATLLKFTLLALWSRSSSRHCCRRHWRKSPRPLGKTIASR